MEYKQFQLVMLSEWLKEYLNGEKYKSSPLICLRSVY